MAPRPIDSSPPLAVLLDELRLVERYLDRAASERNADYVTVRSHAKRVHDVAGSLESLRDAVGDISACAGALAAALEQTRTASAAVIASAAGLSDVIDDLADFFIGPDDGETEKG